jgi:LEA14-like dessication related protein
MKSSLKTILAAATLALPLLAGCGVSKPVVTLHDASLRSASLRGIGLNIFLKVENNNSYDIQIRNVRAEVTIHERYKLAPIDIQPNQWLAAEQTTIVRVPLMIPWQVVPPIVQETLGAATIPYRAQGSVDVTAVRALGIERDNVPLDEQGSVRRQDLVNAAGGMLR